MAWDKEVDVIELAFKSYIIPSLSICADPLAIVDTLKGPTGYIRRAQCIDSQKSTMRRRPLAVSSVTHVEAVRCDLHSFSRWTERGRPGVICEGKGEAAQKQEAAEYATGRRRHRSIVGERS